MPGWALQIFLAPGLECMCFSSFLWAEVCLEGGSLSEYKSKMFLRTEIQCRHIKMDVTPHLISAVLDVFISLSNKPCLESMDSFTIGPPTLSGKVLEVYRKESLEILSRGSYHMPHFLK